jgi:hypothetical protein
MMMNTETFKQLTAGMKKPELLLMAQAKGIADSEKLTIDGLTQALKETMGVSDDVPATGSVIPQLSPRDARIAAFLQEANDVAEGATNAKKPKEERDAELDDAYKKRGLSLKKNIDDALRPTTFGGKVVRVIDKGTDVAARVAGTGVSAWGLFKGAVWIVGKVRGV